MESLPYRFISSPLGLAPKPNGGWRRIHHLSHPAGRSVNDYIPQQWGSLEYPTIDDAIAKIRYHGQGCVLVKRDFADAFRHIPVAKGDQWLLGFVWNGIFWAELFLPFGLRTSPFLFDLFAKGLNWMLIRAGYDVMHYLDDFLGIFDNWTSALRYSHDFGNICNDLGLLIKAEKDRIGHILDFLGIELDTILMQARLPEDKLQKAKDLVKSALSKTSISKEELDSLIGFLCFAAKVVVPGRAFLRRLFDHQAKATGLYIHLNQEIRADLLWWHHFLPKWNGIQIIHIQRPVVRLWTDASGNYGIGGYIITQNQSFSALPVTQLYSEQFTSRLRPKHINVKEMTAILRALQKWLPIIQGSRLILHCDNFAVAAGVRKTSIRGSAMHPLRAIAMLAAINDIQISSRWIPTKANHLADLLSRGKLTTIANKFPHLQMKTIQSVTPQSLGTRKSLSIDNLPDIYGGV